jgi:hypothetical protein
MQRDMAWMTHLPAAPNLRAEVVHSLALAAACLVSFSVATGVLRLVYSVSAIDDQLGGMWAVVATVFVYRESYDRSSSAALSRMSTTGISFALCLGYLLFLPFSAWGLAALIGVGHSP